MTDDIEHEDTIDENSENIKLITPTGDNIRLSREQFNEKFRKPITKEEIDLSPVQLKNYLYKKHQEAMKELFVWWSMNMTEEKYEKRIFFYVTC